MRTIAFMLSMALIFMIPWEGMVNIPGLGTLARMIGLVMAAFWLMSVIVRRKFRTPWSFHFAFFLFVLWNTISILWSADFNTTAIHLLTWIQLLGMIFILWDLYTTRVALLAGLQAYILGAYVAVGSSIANWFAGKSFYAQFQRFSPGDTNPDGFGFILALGIPVACYIASSKSTTKMSGVLKWINCAYIPAAFLGIALSGTRTAAIAAIPGLAFGLSSLTRLRLSVRISALVFLILTFFILLPQVQTTPSFQRLSTIVPEIMEGDLNTRTYLWRAGFTSFIEHPLIGVGSNMYRSVNRLGKLAHNSFISVLVELGLIGLTLFLIILTIAVIHAWRQQKWDSRFWLTTLIVWAIGASSLTYEHRKATWLMLSLLIASAALSSNRKESEDRVIPDDKHIKLSPDPNDSYYRA